MGGASELYLNECAVLMAVLLLATLLLATLLLLTRLLLTTLLLLTGLRLPALLLLTTLLAGLLVWVLIHRSFLSNIGSPLRSLVFHGRSQFAANAFVPGFTLKQCVWNLYPTFRIPLYNKENRRWDAICFCGCLGCQFRFWCSSGFLVVFTRRMIEVAMLPRSQRRAAIATRI
jgi:hypothetical protein